MAAASHASDRGGTESFSDGVREEEGGNMKGSLETCGTRDKAILRKTHSVRVVCCQNWSLAREALTRGEGQKGYATALSIVGTLPQSQKGG